MEVTAAKGRKEDGDMNKDIYEIQLVVNHWPRYGLQHVLNYWPRSVRCSNSGAMDWCYTPSIQHCLCWTLLQ